MSSELNFLFNKIDSQIRSPKINIYSNEREYNLPINKNYSIYERKTDHSSLNQNNISNEKFEKNYKLEEYQKYNQLDKKSNGGYDYESNIYPVQKFDNNNIIKREIEPYSNNINNNNEQYKTSLDKLKLEIENLKQKNNNLGEFNDKIKDFNNKIIEYQNKIALLDKDNQNTSNSLKIVLENNRMKDENIINKYMELEKKFKDLDNKLEVIKNNQNDQSNKLKNSFANNENYKDVIVNLKNQVNEFTTKIENDSMEKLNKMNILYEEKNKNINNELEQLKLNT